MIGVQVKVFGISRVERKLNNLEKKVSRKIVKKALKETAKKDVLMKYKTNAKSMIGGKLGKLIAKNIKLRPQKDVKRVKKGNAFLIVDITKKANETFVVTSKSGKRNYIPNAIEFGHGNVKPVTFGRNTYNETKSAAVKNIGKRIWAGIKAELKGK